MHPDPNQASQETQHSIFLIFNFHLFLLEYNFIMYSSTTTGISCKYTYIPPLLILLPTSPSHPSRSSQSRAELPVLHSGFTLAISFTHGSVYLSRLQSQFVPPSSSTTGSHMPFLYLCLSIPALQTGSSVLSF